MRTTDREPVESKVDDQTAGSPGPERAAAGPLDEPPDAPPRIERLRDSLADQIAAGEVVERPASVVKELLENAIDAGARRVQIELVAAGVESLVVIDDGHGIYADDLVLAVTRHATSKLRRPEDLVEIGTLGFRGEALASMAAVAQLRIRSRPRGGAMGVELVCRPGLSPESAPVGMPVGTRVEVRGLFSNVPVRRKFLRSEATELGHVTQTVLRVALVQPQVYVSLKHGARRLLELPAGTRAQRIEQVLHRGQRTAVRYVEGEHDGIRVQAWLAPAEASMRNRNSLHVVVRQRVVREPNIARIVAASYGDALPTGRFPLACVVVEPPRGEVDVNVHPQKSEIRFGSPQRVYAAVRAVLGTGAPAVASATGGGADGTPHTAKHEHRGDVGPSPSGEAREPGRGSSPDVAPSSDGVAADPGGEAQGAADRGDAAQGDAAAPSPRATLGPILERWAELAGTDSVARQSPPGYRLRTRATGDDYGRARRSLRGEAQVLQQAWRDDRADEPVGPVVPPPAVSGPEYLGCLPGPVALFGDEGSLVAVDLLALRSYLVLRRLRRELGGGDVAAQGLLAPVVVQLSALDVRHCVEGADDLSRLGLHLEGFGGDAVIVRAVPTSLRHCVGEPDVADLVRRMLPWLRMREGAAPGDAMLASAMQAMAQTHAPDPAPRLARRWIKELVDEGMSLDEIPGVRRWSAQALVGERDGR